MRTRKLKREEMAPLHEVAVCLYEAIIVCLHQTRVSPLCSGVEGTVAARA